MRRVDWVESREVAAEVLQHARAVLQQQEVGYAAADGASAASAAHFGGLGDATDEVVRVLDPPPRLAPAAVAEWYCERALQLDEQAGQLQVGVPVQERGLELGCVHWGGTHCSVWTAKRRIGVVHAVSSRSVFTCGCTCFVTFLLVLEL